MVRFFIYFMIIPLIASADIQDRVDALLLARYGDSSIQFEKFNIQSAAKKEIEQKCSQRFLKDFVYAWKISAGDILVIVDAVRAKSAFITIMATFDSVRNVQAVEILDYRGDHGRNVMDSRWLAQFIGKSANSELAIGSDVDAVTGATFSAMAITKGVKRWSFLARHMTE